MGSVRFDLIWFGCLVGCCQRGDDLSSPQTATLIRCDASRRRHDVHLPITCIPLPPSPPHFSLFSPIISHARSVIETRIRPSTHQHCALLSSPSSTVTRPSSWLLSSCPTDVSSSATVDNKGPVLFGDHKARVLTISVHCFHSYQLLTYASIRSFEIKSMRTPRLNEASEATDMKYQIKRKPTEGS